MIKKLCFMLALLLALALNLVACATPATEKTSKAATASADAETSEPPASQDAIAAASSADELRALIAQYQAEGNYELIYAAATRLFELDPSDTEAYIQAADALLTMCSEDIEEINRIMALGGENAQDVAVLAEWAQQHQPDYTIDIPFSPDYASSDEINTEGITAGNQTNAMKQSDGWVGGFLTSQGDWVYLSRLDENFAIYKMRADSSEYQRIGDACGTSLNVVGDWLYYVNSGDGCKLYKMRTDGSLVTKLTDDDCAFLSVSGEWMYYCNYSDEGCLYKMKTDGSEPTKLTNEMVIFPCVAGGWVYYCEKKLEGGGLCRVSVDGGKPQTVVSASLRNYFIDGDWVYYNSEDIIWRVHADGSGEEVFYQCEDTITAFNIAGGVLYLSAGLKFENDGYVIGNRILAIDMANMEAVQHIDFNTEPVCTGPDGWIYFMDDNEGLPWYSLNPGSGEVVRVG